MTQIGHIKAKESHAKMKHMGIFAVLLMALILVHEADMTGSSTVTTTTTTTTPPPHGHVTRAAPGGGASGITGSVILTVISFGFLCLMKLQ